MLVYSANTHVLDGGCVEDINKANYYRAYRSYAIWGGGGGGGGVYWDNVKDN